MATPINILLIEDSPEIREVLGQSVVASGNMCLVGTADNAEAAIRMIDAGNIDAAVIDLDLRGSSGLAVLAYLARIGNPDRILRVVLTNHATPLRVVLTNHATPVFRNRCGSLGADHFLDKSLEFDSAIAILEDFALSKRSA